MKHVMSGNSSLCLLAMMRSYALLVVRVTDFFSLLFVAHCIVHHLPS